MLADFVHCFLASTTIWTNFTNMATGFTNFSFVKISFTSDTVKKMMFTRSELFKRELYFTYFLRELSVLWNL